MKIPIKFRLLGKTIAVRYDPKMFCDIEKFGVSSYRSEEIVLLPVAEATTVSEQGLEETFCHELMHHICYIAGSAIQSRLPADYFIHRDEAFIELMGGLLHQALTTMEYEDET